MIDFDAASLLLQWATGGLLFLWVTTRRREVGLGYGWLMRGIYLAMAAGRGLRRRRRDRRRCRCATLSSIGVALAAGGGAGRVDGAAQGAGCPGRWRWPSSASARVAAMTGIDRAPAERDADRRRVPARARPDRPGHRR